MTLRAFLSLIVLLPASMATAQTEWLTLPAPPARSDVPAAYDPIRSRVVLYGGWDGQRDRDETWEFDGASWIRRQLATNPGALSSQGLAWHGASRSMVMFGGYCGRGCVRGETWTYDGIDWTRRTPAAAPPARMTFAMAEDRGRGVVVLFGGSCGSSGCALGDTWEWDGQRWRSVVTNRSPSPRFGAAMAYGDGEMILHGGRDAGRTFDETWRFDGADWRQLTPNRRPGARSGHQLVYDSRRKRIVCFGASNRTTWEWGGTDWAFRRTATFPPLRSFFGMAFDAARGRTVAVGGGAGGAPLGDAWSYGPTHPAALEVAANGCLGALRAAELPWLGESLGIEAAGLDPSGTFAVLVVGASDSAWAGYSLPLDLAAFGAAGCILRCSVDITQMAAASNRAARFRITVPVDAALLGGCFYAQCVSETSTNQLGLATSDALSGRLGGV